MTIDHRHARRLGIYFFFDAQGIVDEYVFYFLNDLAQNLTQLRIVCNGFVREASLVRLRQLTPYVLVRKNEGMDVGAYRAALESVGYQTLGEFDELILTNFTMFGPLEPFAGMFEEMSRRDLDFWGITSHGRAMKNAKEELAEHIQSHFMVVRRSILQSSYFADYWEKLPPIRNYEDSVKFHESVFTAHFAALGYRWATYTGTEKLTHISPNPILTIPLSLVRDRHCPILKRRVFFQDYGLLLHDTNGDQGREVLDYVQSHRDYPIDLVWDNLLRTCNHSMLRRSLQLNFILPDNHAIPDSEEGNSLRSALWLHLYYIDLLDECLGYAVAIPEDSDILITTDTEEKQRRIESAFSILPNRVTVLQIENRGRDNSALLVGLAPYLGDYDVVCFAHDKKIRHLEYECQGKTFSEHCYHNVLKNELFVKNVLVTFAANPRLGLLCPPPPYASAYYNTIGINDWGPNYENTKALHDRLGLTVPISRDVDPVAPFGSVFWFRTAALTHLFAQGWQYEDFPSEPVDYDGSLLHALERIYPFVAQQAGYYSGWLLSASAAQTELTNYHYMLRELNCRLVPTCGSGDFHELCQHVETLLPFSRRLFYLPLKRFLKAHLSEHHYYTLQKLKKKLCGEIIE